MAGRPRMKLKRIEKLAQMALDLYNEAMKHAPERVREPDQVSQIDPEADPVGWGWVVVLRSMKKGVVDVYALMNQYRQRVGMEPVAVPLTADPPGGRPPAAGSGAPDGDPNEHHLDDLESGFMDDDGDEDGLGDFDDYFDDDDTDENSHADNALATQEGLQDPRERGESARQDTIGGSDGLQVGPGGDRGSETPEPPLRDEEEKQEGPEGW